MEFNNKVKALFEDYKGIYKNYWELINDSECNIKDDSSFMVTALIRAIRSIEGELALEELKNQKAIEALYEDMKEDEE